MVDGTQSRSVYGVRAELSFKSQSSSSFTHKTPPCIRVSACLRLPGQRNNLFVSLQPAVKFQSSHTIKQIMALSPGPCWAGEKEGKWKWEPPALARTEGLLHHAPGGTVMLSPHLLGKGTFCGAVSLCHMSWQHGGTLPWQFATLLPCNPGHFILETTATGRLSR